MELVEGGMTLDDKPTVNRIITCTAVFWRRMVTYPFFRRIT